MSTRRPISFDNAKRQYVHRYTLEHVPQWARKRPCDSGGTETRYYAPQFRTDREWYESTTFPGENGWPRSEDHCHTAGQTWPLGQWLQKPFPGLHAVRKPGEPYDTVTDSMLARARDEFADGDEALS